MPLEEFAKNINFVFPTKGKDINEKAFKTFEDQHGHDIAKGYKMAMADFEKCLGEILIRSNSNGWRPETPSIVKKKVEIFHTTLVEFLNANELVNLQPGDKKTSVTNRIQKEPT
jgi:ABC-type transporter lipoprotein component MlaA